MYVVVQDNSTIIGIGRTEKSAIKSAKEAFPELTVEDNGITVVKAIPSLVRQINSGSDEFRCKVIGGYAYPHK